MNARLGRRCSAWGLAFVCLWATVGIAGKAAGQTVRGRVFDAVTDRLVPNTILRVVDPSDESRAALATDSTGRYVFSLPGSGVYRLRAEQVGYEPFVSESFEARDTADVVTIDIPLRPAPIPIAGVEVTGDRVNRRIREFLGVSPGQLRIKPIRSATIRANRDRGNSLSEMIRGQGIANLQVHPTREGACYQFRGRGCMPVYLDGARLSRAPNAMLPLDMLSTVVILLPNELISHPGGAVQLFTTGFMR